jgi:uncharacterized membrane protein YgcG
VSLLRRRGRDDDGRALPAHPYRDAMLVYGFMAVVLVVVAVATGGEPLRAVIAAVAFFVLATAWSSWRFRERIKRREAAARAASGSGSGSGPAGGASGGNGARGPTQGNGSGKVNGRGETP